MRDSHFAVFYTSINLPMRIKPAASDAAAAASIEQVIRSAPPGTTPQQLRDFLKARGYTDAQIEPALAKWAR